MGSRFLAAALPIVVLLGAPAPPIAGGRAARFVDVGRASGLIAETVATKPPWTYIIDTLGGGAALLDYDLDGDLDLFQVQSWSLEGFPGRTPPTDHLYRNDGGGTFRDVTTDAGLGFSGWGFGAAVGDYDNDGDPDLFVTSYGPCRLYRNEGDGRFVEVASRAGVTGNGWNASAAFLDYDRDGLLDLYVTSYVDFDPAKVPPRGDPNVPCIFRGIMVVCGPSGLVPLPDLLYRNNGDGTFSDVSAAAGLNTEGPYYGLGVVAGDVDGDGDQDVYVANDSRPNNLYVNDGLGRFSDEGLIRGVAYSGDGREQAGMGVDMGDPDGDGDLDIFVTNFSHDYSTLYLNDGSGFFEDATLAAGLVAPSIKFLKWGTAFVDVDNDGDEDIFTANGHTYPEATEALVASSFKQRCQLFLNDGAGAFSEATAGAGPAFAQEGVHRAAAFGDLDEDGDVDVVVTRMYEPPALFRNDLPPGGHWASLRLVGTRSTRDAVGARVRVDAGGRRRLLERKGGGSFQSAGDPRLHIGLGDAARIDAVEIRWPSGLVEVKKDVPADCTVTFVEPDVSAQAPKAR